MYPVKFVIVNLVQVFGPENWFIRNIPHETNTATDKLDRVFSVEHEAAQVRQLPKVCDHFDASQLMVMLVFMDPAFVLEVYLLIIARILELCKELSSVESL